MTLLQDSNPFPDHRRGTPANTKVATRTSSAAPGTRKTAQNPNAEASKPPPIGPRAKPAEVAEEAMPKAAPCRSGGVRTGARVRSSGIATFLVKSGDMEAYQVGRVVKSPKNDGERCIESVA